MAKLGNQLDASRVNPFIDAAAAGKTTAKRVLDILGWAQPIADIRQWFPDDGVRKIG